MDTNITESNEKLLYKLLLDQDAAKNNYSKQMAIIDNWKFELDGRYANGQESVHPSQRDKSVLMMKDIKRTIEGSIPNICDPFLSNGDIVDVTAKSMSSVMAAKAITKQLNKQFRSVEGFVDTIEGLARDLQESGTVFIKSGWGDNAATYEQINVQELIIDPSARKLSDCKFIIQRRKVSISDIISNPQWYGEHTLESLAKLMPTVHSEYEPDENDNEDFNFDDRAREMVEIFEYYGVMDVNGDGKLAPVLAIYSDNMIINFVDSPYPESWKGIPFDSAVYSSKSFSVYGDAISELISDYQKVRTGFMREIINNANNANSSQMASRKGSIDVLNKRKMLKGENYEYNGTEPGIIPAQFNPIPESVFNIVEQFKREQEELSGVSRNNGGVDLENAANKTATAASLAQTNADKRLLQITRHLGSMFESMFKKWIELNQMMFIVDTEDMQQMAMQMQQMQQQGQQPEAEMIEKFEIMSAMQNIDGSFDIQMTVGTNGQKMANINNGLMVLQQLLPLVPAIGVSVSLGILADIATDMDKPLLAHKLMQKSQAADRAESNPQPDPQAQQAAQLELQKLQAEIEKLRSEAAENMADKAKKEAEAMGVFVDTEMTTQGFDVKIG